MSQHEIANVAGVAIGIVVLVAGVLGLVFAQPFTRSAKRRISKWYGENAAAGGAVGQMRFGAILGAILGVAMIVIGLMGKFGSQ